MSGTVRGGKLAAQTNIEKYGPDFYSKIGTKGGRNGHTGGFYVNKELASKAGRLGGEISRRGLPLSLEEAQAIRESFKNE